MCFFNFEELPSCRTENVPVATPVNSPLAPALMCSHHQVHKAPASLSIAPHPPQHPSSWDAHNGLPLSFIGGTRAAGRVGGGLISEAIFQETLSTSTIRHAAFQLRILCSFLSLLHPPDGRERAAANTQVAAKLLNQI